MNDHVRMRITIIVPTYREADAISALVQAVDAVMKQHHLDYGLLVVDDNSPDDITARIDVLADHYPVSLIQAGDRERDLSLSVLEGIRHSKTDHVLIMDADLSHPPEMIPAMVRALEADESCFVIGSRYLADGSFDRAWSLWRFLNSHVATFMAKPLSACTDPMSGFFAFNRSKVDLDSLNPIGYKIGLELLVRGNFSNIQELAINFRDRTVGESKMKLKQQWKYLRHLRRLYMYRFRGWTELVHYGAVGVSGFAVDITCYYALQILGLDHQIARAASFWPAVSWNWGLNRVTTFGERARRPKARQWVEFVCASLVGFSMNWGIYYLLTSNSSFFDSHRLVALIAGILGASLFNFTAATLFVYSEKRS